MVNVIIPTLNAEKKIYNLLKSIENQSVRCEVIIIDSSSSDNTAAMAERFKAVTRIIKIKRRDFDHGGTRTLAAKEAKGDILVFLTQDAVPADERSIENLIKPFSTGEDIGVAYGRQSPYPDASIFSAHLRLFNYQDVSYVRSLKDKNLYGIKTAFLSNSFSAYKKDALERIGWFKEGLISSEDTYAGAKMLLAGYKIAYSADAEVYHSHNYSAFQEFKRYFDVGVFHEREKWLIEEFGKAEGEGKKYILSELSYIHKQKKYHLIPAFFLRNGLKFIGYKLGRHYDKIPLNIIKRLSMHKHWWPPKDRERK